MFVSDSHLPTVLALVPRLKFLKMIVCMDELSDQARQIANEWAKHTNVKFLTFKQCKYRFLHFMVHIQ